MRRRLPLVRIGVGCWLASAWPTIGSGRVGETQGAIESRLLAANVGKRLPVEPDDKDPTGRGRNNEPPFLAVARFFPGDCHVERYWKSAVAHQLHRSDGWEIVVVFAGGVSVLETYRRVGSGMSEFEQNGLLNLHRGASRWVRVDGQEAEPSVLGFTLMREDGEIRAQRRGNWFTLFATKLDTFALARQAEARELAERDREAQRKIDAERAPESIAGF